MSDLEMRHLDSFIAVAEEGSFTRAAQRLHITQPPLSFRIKEMEAILKLSLFERTTKRVRLTLAGRTLLEKLRFTMQSINKAIASARQAQEGIIGSLRVGYAGIASDSLLPRLIRRSRAMYPEIALDVSGPFLTTEMEVALLSEQIDAGICYLPLDNRRIASSRLVVTELVLAVPNGHALARAKKPCLRDAAQDSFVSYPEAWGPLRAAVNAECARAGFRPKVVRESRGTRTLLCLVAAGMGITLVPKEHQERPMEGVTFRNLPDAQVPLHQGVVWRKDDPNPLLAKFLAVSRKSFPSRKQPA